MSKKARKKEQEGVNCSKPQVGDEGNADVDEGKEDFRVCHPPEAIERVVDGTGRHPRLCKRHGVRQRVPI